jgi:hypothetical protein
LSWIETELSCDCVNQHTARNGFVLAPIEFTFAVTVQTKFLLIDFENVQPCDLGTLRGKAIKIKIFVGANQKSIPLELARELHAFGPEAEYIRIQGNGRNALDFHIAFQMGCLSEQFPHASFVILSKDTGFDPLILHLTERKIACQRVTSLNEVLAQTHSPPKGELDRLTSLTERLRKLGTSKPRTLRTLTRWIAANSNPQVTMEEAAQVIEQLAQRGAVRLVDSRVSYT